MARCNRCNRDEENPMSEPRPSSRMRRARPAWLAPAARALAAGVAVLGLATPLQAAIEPAAQAAAERRPQLRVDHGIAVVDIAAPDAHGVSQNAFTRFDVDTAGVVLNNARQAARSELLGAELHANPALRDGAAQLILAEVLGDTATRLRGAIEIAGTRAELIIANPHGIECDGCSFLGSTRALLAAASALRGAQGQLTALQTDNGVLRVGPRGLRAEQIDSLELLARRMRIDGSVLAQDLQASIGLLRQSYDGALRQAFAQPGAAPQLALDVAEAGAMHAGNIALLITEHGAGVRSAGRLHADAGVLALGANGHVELRGQLRGAAAVELSAPRLKLAGTRIDSGGPLRVHATKAVHAIDTGVRADGPIEVSAQSALVFSKGSWRSGQAARFSSPALINDRAKLFAHDALSVRAQDRLDNAGQLRASVVAVYARLLTNGGGHIEGTQGVSATGGTLDNRDGHILGWSDVSLSAMRIDNMRGDIESRGDLTMHADTMLDNMVGRIRSEHALDLVVGGRIDNARGTLGAGRGMRLSAGQALHNLGGKIHGERLSLLIDAPAAEVDNRDGTICLDRGLMRINAQQLLNPHGSIVAPSLTVRAADVDNAHGSLRGEERLDASIEGLRNARGSIYGERAALYVEHLDNRGEGRIVGDVVELDGRLLDNLDGTVRGNQRLELRAPRLNNRGGRIESAGADGALRLRGDTVDNGSGTLHAGGDADIVLGATLHNRLGTVQARGVELLLGERFDNVAGALHATGDARIDAARGIHNGGGHIAAAGTVRLDSHETMLDNGLGRIAARGLLRWDGRWLDNRGGTIEAGRIELAGAELHNSSDASLVALGDVDAVLDHVDNRDGLLQAVSGRFTLRSEGTLDNRGGRLLAGAGLLTAVPTLREAGGELAERVP
jgi:filamentous hemagglutinin